LGARSSLGDQHRDEQLSQPHETTFIARHRVRPSLEKIEYGTISDNRCALDLVLLRLSRVKILEQIPQELGFKL